MEFVYSTRYRADIGSHVFPTEKYNLIYTVLKQEHIITDTNVHEPERPSDTDLLRIVSNVYLDDLLNARLTARTFPSEMPVNRDIIDAQFLCCGGSHLAAKLALEKRTCYHIGGGFHHGFREHAEGFCFLNDVVYAASMLIDNGLKRVAVIDCDLHQGNGTAKFFEREERVFTFSIHQERLYPKKERSDLDIGLDIGTDDCLYLQKLGEALEVIINTVKPEFIIYVAGADPYMFDQLGSLDITVDGLRKRDEAVVSAAQKSGAAMMTVLGGGYAEDVNDTVEIHCNTARVMAERFTGGTLC
jgi:acetoin utilization deacetylase AcuC-like enzyme